MAILTPVAHIFKATTVKFGVRLLTCDNGNAMKQYNFVYEAMLNFVYKKSLKKLLKGPAGIALPSGGDAYVRYGNFPAGGPLTSLT